MNFTNRGPRPKQMIVGWRVWWQPYLPRVPWKPSKRAYGR